MTRSILCTVDTSAARQVCHPAELEAWVRAEGGIEAAAKAIFRSFGHVRPEGAVLRETLSAEIHSLARLEIKARDRVVLWTAIAGWHAVWRSNNIWKPTGRAFW